VVNQGDEVNVKVIEIDAERRRLSLSLKRVEAGETVKRIEMDGTTTGIAERPMPNLGLSEEVFADVEPEGEPEPDLASEPDQPDLAAEPEPVADAEPVVDAEPVADAEPEPAADAEPEPAAEEESAAEPAAEEAPEE
jgi:small subunit ribosomal protein S1